LSGDRVYARLSYERKINTGMHTAKHSIGLVINKEQVMLYETSALELKDAELFEPLEDNEDQIMTPIDKCKLLFTEGYKGHEVLSDFAMLLLIAEASDVQFMVWAYDRYRDCREAAKFKELTEFHRDFMEGHDLDEDEPLGVELKKIEDEKNKKHTLVVVKKPVKPLLDIEVVNGTAVDHSLTSSSSSSTSSSASPEVIEDPELLF
jgi:hypothetical protein